MIIGNVIIINIYYYKRIHLDILHFWKNIIKMSIPVVISLIIGKLILSSIAMSGYLGLFIKGLMFTIIFFVFMWTMGMNNYEKEMFWEPIAKVRNKIIIKIKSV